MEFNPNVSLALLFQPKKPYKYKDYARLDMETWLMYIITYWNQ